MSHRISEDQTGDLVVLEFWGGVPTFFDTFLLKNAHSTDTQILAYKSGVKLPFPSFPCAFTSSVNLV